MRIFAILTLLFVSTSAVQAASRVQTIPQPGSPDPETPRTIEAFDTVFLEEMTWLEVRDAMAAGKKIALIPTGGVEQNGPYLALGKHNIIIQATSDRIARKLGNALVAPVVPFVPEGDIDPPTSHMLYPGTISVRQETFQSLLVDIAGSLKAHGFEQIILIGDSGGNQEGMKLVAEKLSRKWAGSKTSIHFIPEYYDNPRWVEWLRNQGINEVNEGLHDDVRHCSIMMTVDTMTVRMPQRRAKGEFSINGVALDPVEKTLALANRLIDYQATVTVEAIRKAIGN